MLSFKRLIFFTLIVAYVYSATCQAGAISNCDSCTAADLLVCNRCKSGYKLTGAGTASQACVICADYTGKVASTAVNDAAAANEVCDVVCDLTSGIKVCKAATDPIICLDNYFLSAGKCNACDKTCASCTSASATACTSCIVNYSLQGGACKPCASGEWAAHKNKASSCKACDPTCVECSGAADRCVSCQDGLVIGATRKCVVPQVSVVSQSSLTFLQIISTLLIIGMSTFYSL